MSIAFVIICPKKPKKDQAIAIMSSYNFSEVINDESNQAPTIKPIKKTLKRPAFEGLSGSFT